MKHYKLICLVSFIAILIMDIGIYVIQGMGINMYKAIGITALMAAVFIYDTFFYIPADENPLLMVPPKTKK